MADPEALKEGFLHRQPLLNSRIKRNPGGSTVKAWVDIPTLQKPSLTEASNHPEIIWLA
jgi:hypothetical protein